MGRYLVTGCAGFIASNVTRLLATAGHEVIGLDSLNDAYDRRLKAYRLAQLRELAGFSFLEADISRRDSLSGALALMGLTTGEACEPPVSAVLNLAARAGVRASTLDPWTYYETNVIGTLNLLDWCRQQGVRKFVLASSSSVYGDSAQVPYREDQPAVRPVSPYAASKQAAETLAYSYHHLHGMDVSALRYFTVYGPAGRPDMSVFRFVRCIAEGTPLTLYGDGQQRRDFTYVDDIARGTIAALAPVGYEIFNLGGDQPATVTEMIDILARELGNAPIIEKRPAHPADVRQTWANIDLARLKLGWQPEVSLAEGLRACVRWYLANREFARSLDTGE